MPRFERMKSNAAGTAPINYRSLRKFLEVLYFGNDGANYIGEYDRARFLPSSFRRRIDEDDARTNEITQPDTRRNRFRRSTFTRYTRPPREPTHMIADVQFIARIRRYIGQVCAKLARGIPLGTIGFDLALFPRAAQKTGVSGFHGGQLHRSASIFSRGNEGVARNVNARASASHEEQRYYLNAVGYRANRSDELNRVTSV